MGLIKRIIALVVLGTFSTAQIASGQEYQLLGEGGNISMKSATDQTAAASQPFQNFQTSDRFLAGENPLKPVDDVMMTPDYEYERYELKDAVEQLRPEYATAMILKDLKAEDLEKLGDLGFETGILVLQGEIVLFTSGSEDEVGVMPAVQVLTEKASLISHTHPNTYSKEGPSGQDLNGAVEAPDQEYVITHRGVYAYNSKGVLNDGNPYPYDWYLAQINQALENSKAEKDQVAARQDLNEFIKAQDEYNQASVDERITFRRGGTMTYTASLTASNVTTFSGSPYPYITTGATAGPATVSYSDTEGRFAVNYDVTQTDFYSGLRISFDNASTSSVETRDLSSLTSLVLGLQGSASAIKLEFADVNGNKDFYTLTNISSTAERFWSIPLSSLVSTVDKTKIKQIHLYEVQSTTAADTRTGTFKVRINGLNLNAPAKPTVTSSVPTYVSQTTLALTGKKDAYTSILINGTEVVPLDASTTWAYTMTFQEGTNNLNIQSRRTIGKDSSVLSKSTVRDTLVPAGSVTVNNGDAETAFRMIAVSLSLTDATSGLDQMRFSMDSGTTWTSWEAYASSKSLTLPDGNGQKTVKVEVKDKAGNVGSYSDAIILNVPPPFQEVGGVVVIEAEHISGNISRSSKTWEIQTQTLGYSGTGYFTTTDTGKSNDTGYTTKSPELQYQIDVPDAGTYYVWVRGYAPSGDSDTVHVGLDGVVAATSDRMSFWPYASWVWSKTTMDLDASGKNLSATLAITTAGTHTVNVWMREDGFILDKVLLTKDPDFIPQNLGPEESDRVDHAAPTGSFQIEKDETYSFSKQIVLNLQAEDGQYGSGVSRMRFSQDGTSWTDWENFSNQKTLTLSGADGIRRVDVQLKDNAGNTSAFADTIILDTAYSRPPEAVVSSAIYYVSKNGADTADGSEAHPWQSLQRAVSQLRAGDTIYISEGVYREAVDLTSSGLPEAPITIEGLGNVVLDGTDLPLNEHGFDIPGHDYILFKNLTLNHWNAGIEVRSGSHFITIDGLKSE